MNFQKRLVTKMTWRTIFKNEYWEPKRRPQIVRKFNVQLCQPNEAFTPFRRLVKELVELVSMYVFGLHECD